MVAAILRPSNFRVASVPLPRPPLPTALIPGHHLKQSLIYTIIHIYIYNNRSCSPASSVSFWISCDAVIRAATENLEGPGALPPFPPPRASFSHLRCLLFLIRNPSGTRKTPTKAEDDYSIGHTHIPGLLEYRGCCPAPISFLNIVGRNHTRSHGKIRRRRVRYPRCRRLGVWSPTCASVVLTSRNP